MIDLEMVKANIHNEGVITNRRVSVQIPKKPRVFPDYGKGYCVYCGVALPPFKRKYCCDAHGLHYRVEASPYIWIYWPDFRAAIVDRDNDTCGECGIDTYKHNQMMRETKEHPWEHTIHVEVHHIIPLHNGGLEFDPDNCITLCTGCHKLKHQKKVLEPTIDSEQMTLEVS